RPAQGGVMPGLVGLHLQLPADTAGPVLDRRERMRALVRVRPDHDHSHRPFVWMTPAKRISGGHPSLGAIAALLSGHAGDPRAATGDTSKTGQPKRTTRAFRVSPSPAREPNPTGRTSPPRPQR